MRPNTYGCSDGTGSRLVRDRKAGKQRLYGLDARGLRPVHEWTGGFERFWNESFDRLDAYVQDLEQQSRRVTDGSYIDRADAPAQAATAAPSDSRRRSWN